MCRCLPARPRVRITIYMQTDKQLCAELYARGHESLANIVARRLGIYNGQPDDARRTVASSNKPLEPAVTPESDAVLVTAVLNSVSLQPPAPTPPVASEPVKLCEVVEAIPEVDTHSDTVRRTRQAFGQNSAPSWARHFDDGVLLYLFPTGF